MCTGAQNLLQRSALQIGFGGWATSPYRQLTYGNQRVTASSSAAAIGQPLAAARTVTQAAVVCEILVQLSGNPYQCTLGYCTSLGLYFKKWSDSQLPPHNAVPVTSMQFPEHTMRALVVLSQRYTYIRRWHPGNAGTRSRCQRRGSCWCPGPP